MGKESGREVGRINLLIVIQIISIVKGYYCKLINQIVKYYIRKLELRGF